MALSKMKFISVNGMMPCLDKVLTVLGNSGVFHPDDALEFFSETDNFLPIASKNEYAVILSRLKDIMQKTDIKPQIVDCHGYDPKLSELESYVDKLFSKLGAMLDKKEALKAEISRCKSNIENSEHFVGLGLEIEKVEECEYIKANFGRLPKDSYNKLQSYSKNPFVQFFPCSSDDHYYWGVYTAPIEQSDEIDRIFSGLYFEHCEVAGLKGTPINFVAEQKALLNQLEKQVSELDTDIAEYTGKNKGEILKVYSKVSEQDTYFSMRSHVYRYHNTFIIVGWIPDEDAKNLKNKLTGIDSVDVSFSDAKEEIKHSPPVKLKNHFFARPFEYYTDMYGLPNYREIDPSGFIALTYTVLFGIMFGDVGHGIMLFVAALFMWKKMNMPLGRLLISCSISSTVFGLVFGSVCGFEHVLDPMYKALFGFEEKPIEVMSSEMTMNIIVIAVVIGIVLLMVAMCLNIYSSFKRGDIGNALFGVNGFAGLVFYASLVAGLGCTFMFDVQIMNTAYVLCLIVLPIILVFLREPLSDLIKGKKNWMPDSWGGFIVDNIFELFEVCLSYVTNTMSFLRVGAFVLVHAGMMQVVFVLAGMFSDVGYIITVIIGNILVMALEALLVGIQVLRLEYYEMFSRFYIGDGRPYKPIKLSNN